jgi:hypothetical protein
MAARAASVHWPSARNCSESVADISCHTAGQLSACFPVIIPIIPLNRPELC